jgi:hypothetical protein
MKITGNRGPEARPSRSLTSSLLKTFRQQAWLPIFKINVHPFDLRAQFLSAYTTCPLPLTAADTLLTISLGLK